MPIGPELTVGKVSDVEPTPLSQVKDYLALVSGGGLGALLRAPKVAVNLAKQRKLAEALRKLPREDLYFGP